MESFSFYQEAIPCSGVTHAVLGNFSSDSLELLVAKNNLLELYQYKSTLKLIFQFPLQGEVDSLVKIEHPSSKLDLIVLVCKEAKISTLVYSEKVNSLEIIAMHSFENEKGIKDVSIIADPDSRCIVGNLGSNRMFVIPIKPTRLVSKDEQYTHSAFGNEYYKPLFIIDIPIYAKSLLLLKGFSDPVLAILHSPKPIEMSMHAKFMTINLKKKEISLQKEIGGLPADCFTIIPLHSPLKGVLVLGHRSIHYIGESAQRESNMNYYLYNSVYEFINPYKLLLLLCTGELILLSLNYMEKDEMYYLDDKSEIIESIISMELQCEYNAYNAKLLYSDGYLFVASQFHDSMLFKLGNMKQDLNMDESDEMRRRRLAAAQLNYAIDKCDELIGLSGAICSIAINRARNDGENVKEILIGSGYGKNSYISRVFLAIHPFKFESFTEESFPGISEMIGLFSICFPTTTHENPKDLYILIAKQKETTVLRIEEGIEEVTENTQFLVDRETLGTGRIDDEIIYQCHDQGIRLLDNKGNLLRDLIKNGV